MADPGDMNMAAEIVEEVLLRLPYKSLMRSKCVSTFWCNLISNPSFLNKYRAFAVPILFKHTVLRDKRYGTSSSSSYHYLALAHEESDEVPVETILPLILRNGIDDDNDDYVVSSVVEDFIVPPPLNQICRSWNLQIAGHCDGIICLKLFRGNVVLCNPTIKEFKLLPKSCKLLPIDEDDNSEYVYDGNCYTDYLGFGYDLKAKDYKVVRLVVYEKAGYQLTAEVYTLGSNSWRQIETYEYDEYWIYGQIYFEGICYWRVTKNFGGGEEMILSFDMSDELFKEILVPWGDMNPREDMPHEYQWWLGVWKESIAAITFPNPVTEAPRSFDIWVKMKGSTDDARDSWTKCFTIGPTEGVEFPLLSPLAFWKSNKLLMVTDGGVVSYDLRTKTIKYLPIQLGGSICSIQAVAYMNTYVSINGGNKLDEHTDISSFYGIEILEDGSLSEKW